MRLDQNLPVLQAFNAGERAGAVKGTVSAKLSDLDRSGVVYRQHKAGETPAANMPTGLNGVLAGNALGGQEVGANAQATHLEEQARQLVSQTFFGTMLKQMRDSPFKSDLFEGGRGGQAYSGLYDQKLTEQMSRGAGKKLVDAILRKFDAKKAYNKQAKTADLAANQAAQLQSQSAPAASAPLEANRSMSIEAGDATNPYRNVKIHVAPALRS